MQIKKIAIIRLSALGDVIISASFLGWLGTFRAQGYEIEWFIDTRFADVIKDSPFIDKIHALDFKKMLKSLSGFFELKKYCKSCAKYEAVIDLQGLIKSSIVGKMLDSKRYVGFSFKGAREGIASFFYTQKVDISYHANILERNFALLKVGLNIESNLQNAIKLRKLGFSYDADSINLSLKNMLNSSQDCIKILFVLEASISEKIYPATSFINLANLLHNFLDSKGQKVTFFLTFKDNINAANEIFNALKLQNIESKMLNNLNFNDLKFVLTHIDFAIGGDTGLTYLAWALGVETISLYGNRFKQIDSKIDSKVSAKNMRNTNLNRILLGNPYLVSHTNTFEIASISPNEVFNLLEILIESKS